MGLDVRLNIVGLGVNPWTDATLKAIEQIREASVVFCAPFHERFVNAYKQSDTEVKLIFDHLTQLPNRESCYQQISTSILESFDKERCVTWVTSGDPAINCGISQALSRIAQKKQIMTTFTSGLPSFIVVNATIPQEERTDSVIQLSARHLFLNELSIDIRFCLFIIQVFQHITNQTVPALELRTGSLAPMQARLLKFYTPEHLCYLVVAPTEYTGSKVAHIRLDDLNKNSELVTPETTLVVPPVKSLDKIYDEDLLRLWLRPNSEKYLSPLETLARYIKEVEKE
jgi:uncharacterized protein YabN with tetrapyrrole methylase and pyrophosphatase domain